MRLNKQVLIDAYLTEQQVDLIIELLDERLKQLLTLTQQPNRSDIIYVENIKSNLVQRLTLAKEGNKNG